MKSMKSMPRMKRANRNQTGFTLLEIVVVLAVVGALSAMLSPVVFRYIDDANRSQAQNDTNVIAAAIQQMYRDTGRWAFYSVGVGALTHANGTDAELLSSNASCNLADAGGLAACDDAEPVIIGAGWTVADQTDSLTNQLVSNNLEGTNYLTAGGNPNRWRGPYLDSIPAVDPWGRSYLVNIGNADPNEEGQGQKWVVVISAGPDGNIDTAGDTAGNANPTVAGDDVISRVK